MWFIIKTKTNKTDFKDDDDRYHVLKNEPDKVIRSSFFALFLCLVSALGYYRQSMETGGFSEEDFMKAFEEDLHVLIARGIRQDEVPIVLDQLRYSLEG